MKTSPSIETSTSPRRIFSRKQLARAAAIGLLLPALSCSSGKEPVETSSRNNVERAEQPRDFYDPSATATTEDPPRPEIIVPDDIAAPSSDERFARVARFTGQSSSGATLEGYIGMKDPVPASNFPEEKSHCSELDIGTPLAVEFELSLSTTADVPLRVVWSADGAFRAGDDRMVLDDFEGGGDPYRCTSQYRIKTWDVQPGEEVNMYGIYFINDGASAQYPQGKPEVVGGTFMNFEFEPFNDIEFSGPAAIGCDLEAQVADVNDVPLNGVLFAGDVSYVPPYLDDGLGNTWVCRAGS